MLSTMPVPNVVEKFRLSLRSYYTTDYAKNTHVTMFLREVNIG